MPGFDDLEDVAVRGAKEEPLKRRRPLGLNERRPMRFQPALQGLELGQRVSDRCVELITEKDEEYESIKDADGRIHDQNGLTVIGWKTERGEVMLELVYEG